MRFYPKAIRFYQKGMRFYPKSVRFYPKGVRFYPKAIRFYPKGMRFYPKGMRFYPKGIRFYLKSVRFYPKVIRFYASAAVEAARVAMCTGQYANLGALIQHFAATPENINQYFDLQGIRNGQQVLFTGDTNPQQSETIMQHTFGAKDMLLLQNEGSTELRFYLASQKDDAPATTTVIVAAGTEQQVPITSLGSIALTFVNVYNPDTINKGEWTVQLQ